MESMSTEWTSIYMWRRAEIYEDTAIAIRWYLRFFFWFAVPLACRRCEKTTQNEGIDIPTIRWQLQTYLHMH